MKNVSKSVKEFSAKEKAQQLQIEINKEKAERVKEFLAVVMEAEEKYNCGLMARTLIEGNKITTQILPFAKD